MLSLDWTDHQRVKVILIEKVLIMIGDVIKDSHTLVRYLFKKKGYTLSFLAEVFVVILRERALVQVKICSLN